MILRTLSIHQYAARFCPSGLNLNSGIFQLFKSFLLRFEKSLIGGQFIKKIVCLPRTRFFPSRRSAPAGLVPGASAGSHEDTGGSVFKFHISRHIILDLDIMPFSFRGRRLSPFTGMPHSHCSRSSWCGHWFNSTPPPSPSQVAFQPAAS